MKTGQSEPRSGLRVMGAPHPTTALGVRGRARPTRLAPEGRTREPGAGRRRGTSAERWAARGVSRGTDQARARLTWEPER